MRKCNALRTAAALMPDAPLPLQAAAPYAAHPPVARPMTQPFFAAPVPVSASCCYGGGGSVLPPAALPPAGGPPVGGGGGLEAGDWQCNACSNINYSFRSTCNMRRCGAPRPVAAPLGFYASPQGVPAASAAYFLAASS